MGVLGCMLGTALLSSLICYVIRVDGSDLLEKLSSPGKALLSTATTGDFSDIKLLLVTRNGVKSFDVDNASSIIADANFTATLPTALFIHGYLDNSKSDSVTLVTEAFARRGSHNIIAVDWSAYNGFPYLSAFGNLPGVGRTVGRALNSMVRAGLAADSLWLVGHSLGAQMTSILATTVNFDIPKITGLDPALPGFKAIGVPRLTRHTAKFVEVVHTDAGGFGFDLPCGHIDIWPNGGDAVQPGCLFSEEEEVGCSHSRSFVYFAESLDNSQAFPAVRCSSWLSFRRGACPVSETNIVFLGNSHSDQNQTGDYFLYTNRATPFGKGFQGVNEHSLIGL